MFKNSSDYIKYFRCVKQVFGMEAVFQLWRSIFYCVQTSKGNFARHFASIVQSKIQWIEDKLLSYAVPIYPSKCCISSLEDLSFQRLFHFEPVPEQLLTHANMIFSKNDNIKIE